MDPGAVDRQRIATGVRLGHESGRGVEQENAAVAGGQLEARRIVDSVVAVKVAVEEIAQ